MIGTSKCTVWPWIISAWLILSIGGTHAGAAVAGRKGMNELKIVTSGRSKAVIVVSAEAGKLERLAADDLARYIERMSGAKLPVLSAEAEVRQAMQETQKPVLVVGAAALEAKPKLQSALNAVAKKNPVLRADAMVLQRDKNRVYMVGLTDDGHYHAVAELLDRWGCRWYIPTEIGACIPEEKNLSIGDVDFVYASPFEMRSYWLSWNASGHGKFPLRNRATVGYPQVPTGHNLAHFTKDLAPEGESTMSIPIAEDATADHIVKQLEPIFAKGGHASLGIEDGVYTSTSQLDVDLQAGLFDKYMMNQFTTDMFMTLYNKVCERLLEKYPDSKSKFGFLAYTNLTIPPQQVMPVASPMICSLAAIDIDPTHPMDSELSPPRREYRRMMERWATVMEGRLWIYDYDQGMLIWRDFPNPSHMAFRHDVKYYAQADIMGIGTESRGAIATTFLNLYLRCQLMWNPDFDVDAALKEFYPKFYGPAAGPMRKYWTAIYKAWENTIVTEHEFFVAPAIYPPALIKKLSRYMDQATEALQPLSRMRKARSRNEELYLERLKFTRLMHTVMENYMGMVEAATTRCDYAKANKLGRIALDARLEMAQMNDTFCVRVATAAPEPNYGGSPAWFPGEVKMYEDIDKLCNGEEGTLLMKLPLVWPFRRDPHDTGLASGWGWRQDIGDLSYWKKHKDEYTVLNRKDYPTTEWEKVRTDLYLQAQGIQHPDRQAFTGYGWYRNTIKLTKHQAAQKVHLYFPGIFAESWIYVNGRLLEHRPQRTMWWHNDYTFSWDVDLTGKLHQGDNLILVRNHCEHHVSGMFRRPFLYLANE